MSIKEEAHFVAKRPDADGYFARCAAWNIRAVDRFLERVFFVDADSFGVRLSVARKCKTIICYRVGADEESIFVVVAAEMCAGSDLGVEIIDSKTLPEVDVINIGLH